MNRLTIKRAVFASPRNRLVSRMLGWPRPTKRFLMVLADLVVVPAALWMAFTLKFDSLAAGFNRNLLFYVGVAAASTLIFAFSGLYRAVVRFIGIRVLLSIVAGVTGSAIVLTVLSSSLPFVQSIPPSVAAIFWLLAFFWVTATRLFARWLLTPFEINGTRVVIYGAGDAGAQLSMALASGRQFVLLAYADEKHALQGTLMNGVPVIAPEDLADFVARARVERILLAVPSASRRRKAEILRRLEALNIHVQSVPAFNDVLNGRARVDELREIDVADLLGRDPIPPNRALLDASIRGKSVMVSGAGGSIGSELCRQIILLAPTQLVLFENSEFALYNIERELQDIVDSRKLDVKIHALLGNAHHKYRVRDVMQSFGVQTVYHAAAYKHVPIVEQNLVEGVHNNVFSTWHAAEAALEVGVETFVLISTDKAVNPTNVMGATKRLAEVVLQSLQTQTKRTRFCMVRFGNVLGSSGSVVPALRGPDSARRPGHGDAPRGAPLLHDDPRVRAARAPGRLDGDGRGRIRARHGPAGRDRRAREANDQADGPVRSRRLESRRGYRDRVFGIAAGGEAFRRTPDRQQRHRDRAPDDHARDRAVPVLGRSARDSFGAGDRRESNRLPAGHGGARESGAGIPQLARHPRSRVRAAPDASRGAAAYRSEGHRPHRASRAKASPGRGANPRLRLASRWTIPALYHSAAIG